MKYVNYYKTIYNTAANNKIKRWAYLSLLPPLVVTFLISKSILKPETSMTTRILFISTLPTMIGFIELHRLGYKELKHFLSDNQKQSYSFTHTWYDVVLAIVVSAVFTFGIALGGIIINLADNTIKLIINSIWIYLTIIASVIIYRRLYIWIKNPREKSVHLSEVKKSLKKLKTHLKLSDYIFITTFLTGLGILYLIVLYDAINTLISIKHEIIMFSNLSIAVLIITLTEFLFIAPKTNIINKIFEVK